MRLAPSCSLWKCRFVAAGLYAGKDKIIVRASEFSEPAKLDKQRLGLIINKRFHEENRWCSATTFHLVEAIKAGFECVYIQNQRDYEKNLGEVDLLISMEPGWASPVLELSRTQALREKLAKIPSYIFYSDPHAKKWREDYFLGNELDYVLAFYWGPFRHHFKKIRQAQLIHFPWAIPDHWISDAPIVFHSRSKICCFGGWKSKAYELRNWCRSFEFVESATNSGVENKVMSESEYIDWLRERDAAIAAGSDSPEYKLTVPKYFEIAAAGSLLFAQQTEDLALLGFEHKRNCIIFNRSDLEQLAGEYLANPESYLQIRQAGRELIRQRHLLSQRMNLLAEHVSMALERKAKPIRPRQSSKSVLKKDNSETVESCRKSALTSREYWDHNRKKEFKPWEVKETQFSSIFEKYLPVDDNFSCVEIGAYPGSNLCYLAKRFKYYPVAIEFSEHCDHIEKLLRFNGIEKFKVLKQDLFDPVDMKFDIVTSFGFIEHFENYEEVIDRHVQLLKPGGYLVMSCPYLDNFQGRLRELVYTEEKLQQVLSSHNLKVMNLDEIKRVLSKYDMEICLSDFIMSNKIWFDPNADYIKPQMRWLVKYLLTINAVGGERIPSSRLYSPMIMVIARDKSNVRKESSRPVSIQDVLEQRQWLSRGEIEQRQWQDLKSLLEHSYNNVPFYRRRFDSAGLNLHDIQTMDDFRKIPVLKKADIQQNLEMMRASNCPADQLIRDATGGSTGQPLVFYRDLNAKAWIDAASVRFRRWMGYRPTSKLALIWGAGRDIPESYPSNQRWLNTFNCSEEEIERFIAELVQWKPDAIRAYASSLYMVASYIKSKGLQAPCPGVIESAAEKLWDWQRKVVEQVFGCKVFEMYGSREIPALACECEYHNGMHIFSDLRLVEVIKDGRQAGPGEEGSIVITDLVNYGMPFIRYEIGDVGVISEESCKCGRGFGLLKEIKGRITSTIQTPDGRYVHGEYFTHLFYNITGVKAFQVHQTKLDEVIVLVQPDKGFDGNMIEQVIGKMRSHLGSRVNVNWKCVDDIPKAASGKRHFTISEITADFVCTGDDTRSLATAVSAARTPEHKNVLFIVDQPGWAHDFKTDNLIRRLGDRFNMTKRYEDKVTADDIARADLVVLYYWRQFNHSNMPGLLDEFIQNRHKLLIGICSHQEMAHDRDEIIGVIRYFASGVFVNSMLLYREFSQFFEVPVFYTPNGVDTDFFTPAPIRPTNRKLRVGWAGSITNHGETRGYHDLILPAIGSVEGVELTVAAREDKWRSLEEMLEFYRSIDVYICASAAEGTPNPCLEAAACGIPLLTTRVGNMPEFIEDGKNGFLIERDVNDIKNKLIMLRDNPALRLKMSAEILKSIQAWDWKAQAQNYHRMFRTMLAAQNSIPQRSFDFETKEYSANNNGRDLTRNDSGEFQSKDILSLDMPVDKLSIREDNRSKKRVDKKYNIIIVLADALRADHLSCYGYHRRTSPNIDSFAEQGVLFRSAYSVSSSTVSAIPSILTGLYPTFHGTGVDGNILNLNRDTAILPEILKEKGYVTFGVNTNPLVDGKYGYSRGFDYRFDVYPSAGNKFVKATIEHDIDGCLRSESVSFGQPYICSNEINRKVADWLKKNMREPLFMWLHYMDIHSPYLPREPFFSRNVAGRRDKDVVAFLRRFNEVCTRIHKGQELPSEEKQFLLDCYDSAISYFDFYFGRLIETLKEYSLLENTLIFVVADHGEEFWEHGHWGHYVRMYDYNLHIPMIMSCPGLAQGGRVISKLVSNIDIFATIQDLLDINGLTLSGKSLLPYIRDEGSEPEKAIISEGGGVNRLSGEAFIDRLYAVRTSQYKYIKNSTKGKLELYDLLNDPQELRNLAQEFSMRGVISELDNTLYESLGLKSKRSQEYENPEFSEEVAERLKALGYL